MERKDFWKLGPVWVWKWLVIGGIFTVSVGILAVFGLPFQPFAIPEKDVLTYRYNDPALETFSGVAKVVDETGTVRYWGDVDAGSFTGRGQVFDSQGQLVYDGPLVDGIREGADAQVYENGLLVYEGEMVQDVYEGAGREYEDGVLAREGSFQDGLLSGEGTAYGQGGALLYQGEFRRGVYHGQGKLYDPDRETLLYEGEFVDGKARGTGQLYHPSGQLLYTGAVQDGRPRADAFLGLSLTEVEGAFPQHWILYYASDGSAAFVYPYFGLMFWTDGPVKLVSPTLADAQAEKERRELLNALSTPAQEVEDPQGVYEVTEDVQEPVVLDTAEETGTEAALDMALDPDTDESGLIIREVLSYKKPLAGVAQPGGDDPTQVGLSGWREWFSDFAVGGEESPYQAVKIGPFVYEFPEKTAENTVVVERQTAQQGDVETVTAYREDKEGTWWYQSAVEKRES